MRRIPAREALCLGRALRLVWRSGAGWTVAGVALLVVQGLLPLLALYLRKLIVDAVAAGVVASEVGEAFEEVLVLLLLAALVALVVALCRTAAALVSEAQAQAVTDHVHDILHAKSIEVDLEYYENSQYYDTLHRAQQEAPFRPTKIVNGFLQIGQSGVSLLAVAGLLITFHWGVALLLLAIIPGVLVRIRYAGQLYRWQRGRTPIERLAWYFHVMLTQDWHAKEIRLFDLGSLFRRKYHDLRRKLRRERMRITTRRSLAELVMEGLSIVAVFGSYAFIAHRAVQGAITLGDLVMYFQAFQLGQAYLRDSFHGLASLYEDSLFLTCMYDFLDLERKVVEPSSPRPFPRPIRSGLVFDHVRFRYANGSRNVLEDVHFEIRPGEVVALVGENGSGKTTLIKLLARLYDPTAGRITVDGIDLREFETVALRREMNIIFQDYAKYYLTARENIWFGNVDLSPEDDGIAAAARHAGAEDVILGLPRGYDTVLGKWFEDGEELSVGEWQKLALARAFVRDAQWIILDEPTSAMDPLAEAEFFESFRELASGRTTILISHRLSTVRMAARIFVLEDGRIIESGSHDELVRTRGRYARLFESQARNYR